MSKYIDLHVHSNYSDGKHSLEYIAKKAIENSVNTLSLAEHYNLSSYHKFRRIVGKSIEVIPSTELSASLTSYGLSRKHICHFVAYYPTDKIYEILDFYEISRNKCVKKTIEVLKKQGINISYTDVLSVSRDKSSVGRFDIAIALHRKGLAPTPESAYGRFFDENSPVYIDREKMSPEELIKKIILCKGVPVLVHPKSLKLNNSDFVSFISELKGYGLCGIEVYNPHNSEEMTHFYNDVCDDYKLIKTVGTDYHGRSNDNIEIGYGINNNLCISDYSIVENLKQVKKSLYG